MPCERRAHRNHAWRSCCGEPISGEKGERFSGTVLGLRFANLRSMKRYFGPILIACLSLAACKEDEPEPRSREVFCRDWAIAACSEEVVSVCQAADAESCRQSQEDFCRTIAPESFAGDRSDMCIEAVAAAYADGDLSGSELLTVRLLAEPCHQLSRGTRGEGQSCMERNDCNSAAGFDCVKKSDRMSGTCEIPEMSGPGEDCEADQQICTTGFFCNGENCIAARDEGDPCMHHEECEDGFCDVDGACAARFDIGDPCDDDAQCGAGICYDFDGELVCANRIVLTRTEPICEDLR